MGLLNCGQALVKLLGDYGIDTAFGIPGVHNIEMYRNFDQHNLKHVLTCHEQGAAFMADGYARVKGKPAGCFLISGPGLTNAATPIAQAYSDSQPMVVVATTNLRTEIGKGWGPFHELRNQRLIAEQFCAYAGQALSPQDIPEVVAMAFATLASGRPRPVYIEIPRDILAEPAHGDWVARPLGSRPAPQQEAVAKATDLLATAERPLMLIGAGSISAAGALKQIAEKTNAIVISSFCGKGVIAESHPNVLGAALSMPEARQLVRDADVVLAIGTELSTVDSSNQGLNFDGKLIRVDIDARKMSDRYAATVAIVADSQITAETISARLDSSEVRGARNEWLLRLEQARGCLEKFGSPGVAEHRRVLDSLREALPENTVVVGDMTQLAYSGNHHFRVDHPASWLHPASYATLGFALPTAIGAKIARPDLPVVSIAGDFGFLFSCQEMATATANRVPVVQVIWNNEALGEISDAMTASNIEPVEVSMPTPDYLALAKSFGWQSVRASSCQDLADNTRKALNSDMPTLIEVRAGAGDWAG